MSPDAAKEPAKQKVFISHIHLEQDVALILDEWLEASFDPPLEVFVSSSPDLGGLGKWLKNLQDQLSLSGALLVLASPLALRSHWVFFETGFAAALERTDRMSIIPVCSYGQLPDDLTPPLTEWTALQLLHPKFGPQLVQALRTQLNAKSVKNVDYRSLRTKITGAEHKLDKKIRLLRMIAGRSRNNSTLPKLKKATGIGLKTCQDLLVALQLGGFVSKSRMGAMRDPGYSIKDRGTKVLERLHLPPLIPKDKTDSEQPAATSPKGP